MKAQILIGKTYGSPHTHLERRGFYYTNKDDGTPKTIQRLCRDYADEMLREGVTEFEIYNGLKICLIIPEFLFYYSHLNRNSN